MPGTSTSITACSPSEFRRNPTNVECFQLAQANSEHSRHWFFKGALTIDGKAAAETLLGIIRSTLAANPSNSVIAFSDNSSAIRGFEIPTIVPAEPGRCSRVCLAARPVRPDLHGRDPQFSQRGRPLPGRRNRNRRPDPRRARDRPGLAGRGRNGRLRGRQSAHGRLPDPRREPRVRISGQSRLPAADPHRGEQRRVGLRQQVR